jgi:hypothetical protein
MTAVRRSFLFLSGFFPPIVEIAHPLHAYAIHIFTCLYTLPPTYLLAYAMLTSTNENNANVDIVLTWLALN